MTSSGRVQGTDVPQGVVITDSISHWQKLIMDWCERKGWNENLEKNRTLGDWFQLISGELNEAYEDHRNHHAPGEIYFEDQHGAKYTALEVTDKLTSGLPTAKEFAQGLKPCGIPIELADAAIRMLHMCEYYGIDLGAMIEMKMAYNEKRPYRHGGKAQ